MPTPLPVKRQLARVNVDDSCGGRLRPRKDRLGDFFEVVLEIGEVMVLLEVGHPAKSPA